MSTLICYRLAALSSRIRTIPRIRPILSHNRRGIAEPSLQGTGNRRRYHWETTWGFSFIWSPCSPLASIFSKYQSASNKISSQSTQIFSNQLSSQPPHRETVRVSSVSVSSKIIILFLVVNNAQVNTTVWSSPNKTMMLG